MTDHRTEALKLTDALKATIVQAGIEDWDPTETALTIATYASNAQTHAILAVADALNQAAAGTCTAVYHVTIIAPHDTATYGCRHPHGHTGAHQDRNRTTTWLDHAHGAYHLNDPQPTPAPTGVCPAADTTHTSNETVIHGCVLTYQHDGPHTSGTGHTWHDQPRACGAYRDPDDWSDESTDRYGPVIYWPCVLPAGHTGPHADPDGDTFPRT